MDYRVFIPYLLVMALVTYLIRVIPLVMIKKKITNRFFRSFLYYVPYTVLSAMTFPAILHATDHMVSAAAAFAAAIILALYDRSLIVVAVGACSCVFLVELALQFL